MIVKLHNAGKSFKGLGKYLTRDVKAQTDERVAWTHTLNCANDHVPSAIHEMYQTFLDADLLKEEAGIRRGGRPLDDAVKHFSLNWHPHEKPTQAEMVAAVDDYLAHMGWQDHQAVLAAHADKPHAHVHCMLNAVHPETGKKLDDGLEYRRSQAWALEYERLHEQVRCPQRELPPEEREPSPQRAAWLRMKEGEGWHRDAEAARQRLAELAAAREEPLNNGAEWKLLKTLQREERDAFFAGGQAAYQEARDQAFREVRAEFRDDWKEYFTAKRDGLDRDLLADIRDGLAALQDAALIDRRNELCTDLRQQRDGEYDALLAMQRADRAALAADQRRDERPDDLGQRLLGERGGVLPPANQNSTQLESFPDAVDSRAEALGAFRAAAAETVQTVPTEDRAEEPILTSDADLPAWPRGQTRAEDPRVRDPLDIGTDLGAAAIGGFATLTERLFDGFLDDSAPRPPPRPKQNAESAAPDLSRNVFAEAANAARRTVEREAEERRANDWWEERRARD